MKLSEFEDKPIRLTTRDGDVYEGLAEIFPAGYGLHEFDWDEESVKLGRTYLFESQIRRIEPLDPERVCGFFGAEFVPEAIRELYRDLRRVWSAETCTPRLRERWSPANPGLGQCSITAFLVQELFGGTVRGIPLPDGGVHCYNELNDHCFDLTSEQLDGEDFAYIDDPEQLRELQLAKAEKRARYALLKQRLQAYREGSK